MNSDFGKTLASGVNSFLKKKTDNAINQA